MAERLPPIPPESYSPAQKAAADDFMASRKTPLFGPFLPLLYSPEVLRHAQNLGEYLRYRNSIGQKLSEFAILITAREWSQDYEWYVHHPLALKAGVDPAIAQAICDGRRPDGMGDDEAAIYDFAMELHRNKCVCDNTYKRVAGKFGEQGVIDLIGILGYYALLAMTLNVSRFPLPDGERCLPRFPDIGADE